MVTCQAAQVGCAALRHQRWSTGGTGTKERESVHAISETGGAGGNREVLRSGNENIQNFCLFRDKFLPLRENLTANPKAIRKGNKDIKEKYCLMI